MSNLEDSKLKYLIELFICLSLNILCILHYI